MKRFLAFLLVVTIVVVPFFDAVAQVRYQVPTQVQGEGPAPSFRGGQQQPGIIQEQGIQQIPNIPSTGMQSGTGGGAAGTTAGETAMVSLGYQVHVLGEVTRPGTYKVTASERVSEVIRRAGGFAPNGSERFVEVRRKGGGVIHVDLTAFTLFGRLDQNPYVTDNDTIFVPLRKKVIQVAGAVRRPEYYELKNEKTLEDVIELSGGFNAATSMSEPIRVIRFVNGEKQVEEVPIEKVAMKQFDIENGDVVVVPNVVTKDTQFDYNVASIPGDQVFYPSYEDRVFVLGGVAVPGAYPFSPYYMLNQYISLAGGITPRGKTKFKVVSIDGKSRKADANERVNPGDTILVEQRWMEPAGWLGFALGVASFGLSASATIIALRK